MDGIPGVVASLLIEYTSRALFNGSAPTMQQEVSIIG